MSGKLTEVPEEEKLIGAGRGSGMILPCPILEKSNYQMSPNPEHCSACESWLHDYQGKYCPKNKARGIPG